MNQDQKLGVIRHVLTFVGGILLTKGLVDESLMTDLVASIMVIIGGVWSITSKRV
jgi:hypothetical protein